VELFLLHSEPETYARMFSVFEANAAPGSSALYFDTLGRPDAYQELLRSLSYANIHDVSSSTDVSRDFTLTPACRWSDSSSGVFGACVCAPLT
jgi:hypothetical protein